MTLIQSWKDSLTLLKPKNLQLFVMVTIKSIIDTYKLLIRYFWWLFVAIGVCYYIAMDTTMQAYNQFLLSPIADVETTSMIMMRWIYELLFFATCVATRPSIMRKDFLYFRTQMISFGYMAIFLLVIPLFLWPTAVAPWHIFLTLFFLDSEKRPKDFFISMWLALKMIGYNYPLLAIMCISFYIPVWIFHILFFAMPLAQNVFVALLLPIGVCTFTNVYIKKLHDQFDLYFKQSQ